jgi:hypothetical protein
MARAAAAGAAAGFKRSRRWSLPSIALLLLAVLLALLPTWAAVAFVFRGPGPSISRRGSRQRGTALLKAAGPGSEGVDRPAAGRPRGGGGGASNTSDGRRKGGGGGGSGPPSSSSGPDGDRRGHPHQQQHDHHHQQQRKGQHHHSHRHYHDTPSLANTRLKGRCYQSLLDAIETHADDVANVEELTDALSRSVVHYIRGRSECYVAFNR